jgi:hypothetical protein
MRCIMVNWLLVSILFVNVGCPLFVVGCEATDNGPRNTDYGRALVRLRVEPPDAEIWIGEHRVESQGRERVLVTPPLEAGRRYVYSVGACWPGPHNRGFEDSAPATQQRTWELAVEAGKIAELTVAPWRDLPRPSKTQGVPPVQEPDGVKNFGIVRSQLGDPPANGEAPGEHIRLNDQPITKAKALRLLQSRDLTDDSGKLRLTLIGPEDERQKVLDDLNGPLADLAGDCLVQSYAPDHWAVARAGFHVAGRPTIYVQEPSGKVLHRQDDYADGAAGLRRVLEAVRKPDPKYDGAKDPDLRKSPELGTWVFLAAVAVLLLVGLRKKGS